MLHVSGSILEIAAQEHHIHLQIFDNHSSLTNSRISCAPLHTHSCDYCFILTEIHFDSQHRFLPLTWILLFLVPKHTSRSVTILQKRTLSNILDIWENGSKVLVSVFLWVHTHVFLRLHLYGSRAVCLSLHLFIPLYVYMFMFWVLLSS